MISKIMPHLGWTLTACLASLTLSLLVTPQAGAQVCAGPYTSTNAQHVTQGRAQATRTNDCSGCFLGLCDFPAGCTVTRTTYRAVGSGESLGTNGAATTTLYESPAGEFSTATCSACAAAETLCGNGLDEDCDGQVDCDDSDCAGLPVCGPSCGDNVCEGSETSNSCPADCPTSSPGTNYAYKIGATDVSSGVTDVLAIDLPAGNYLLHATGEVETSDWIRCSIGIPQESPGPNLSNLVEVQPGGGVGRTPLSMIGTIESATPQSLVLSCVGTGQVLEPRVVATPIGEVDYQGQ